MVYRLYTQAECKLDHVVEVKHSKLLLLAIIPKLLLHNSFSNYQFKTTYKFT